MDLVGIGYSNIRLPNSSSSYIYTYDTRINTFPEEVFIHEFLHSLERTIKEYGYDRPELHDYEKYGYKEEKLNGLKTWYRDYMRCNIIDNVTGTKIGLNPIVYTLKQPHESNFKYTMQIEFENEPSNIIEEIKCIFTVVLKTISFGKIT